jgi:hypothetical protein
MHYRRGVLSPLHEYDFRSANGIFAGDWISKQVASSSIVPAVTEPAAVSFRYAVHRRPCDSAAKRKRYRELETR